MIKKYRAKIGFKILMYFVKMRGVNFEQAIIQEFLLYFKI